jgi:hypothetical protein
MLDGWVMSISRWLSKALLWGGDMSTSLLTDE